MGIVKLWTIEEDKFLRENYPEYGPKWCGEKLERTKGGVQRRANVIGVKSLKKKIKYHEDNLKVIVSDSRTLSEVLNKLGLRCAGGNFNTLNKYIKQYNLDTSHFETSIEQYERVSNLNKMKKSLDEILVENSNYSRTHLKKRLVDEGLLDYKCRKCDNEGEWMGEKITLQLEHINGVHNDNRIKNLEFLCPNCHSQTSTYAGKKNKSEVVIIKKLKIPTLKRKRVIIKTNKCSCGIRISDNASKCVTCFREQRRNTERPPYQQLIGEINDLGYSGTGRKYGVSDNAIRKWKVLYEK